MRAAALLVSLAAGCGAQLGGGSSDDAAGGDDPALSPLGNRVLAALRDAHPDGRGRTWGVAHDDALAPGWILQTPPASFWGTPTTSLPVATACTGDPACDPDFGLVRCTTQADCRFGGTCSEVAATVTSAGARPLKLCTGHSDALYDEIYKVIANAQQLVDIASLEAPDGRFEAAVRNALTFLAHSGRGVRVRVRVLYGAVPLRMRATADVLATLVRDLPPGAPLTVGVGAYRDSIISWNHTKLIAADGAVAIVGGHNMWTQHYLQQAPVHDISLRLSGGAAADASRFADELWQRVCFPGSDLGAVATSSDFPGTTTRECDDPFAHVADPGTLASASGTASVITVGKLGGPDTTVTDPGEDAILALIAGAQTRLRLSLQDIGPVGAGSAWPEPYLAALRDALARGVDIDLVLSNMNAFPGGLMAGSASYSNGWTPLDVARQLVANRPELRAAACTHLHATTLRQDPSADTWPDGTGFANHAKLVIADDSTFYLGSQNWYPAQLSELGFIVDDATATRELLADYYTPLWTASSRVAVDTCNGL
jgi:phosphatidylserine/phosphatidylglycerophosphate/cardiolipin synthase-like enzyme